MIKKIAILSSCLLLITGCSSTDTEVSIEAGPDQQIYENAELAIVHPLDWEIIEGKNITAESNKGTIAAIRNNIQSDIFTANLTISKSFVDKDISEETLALNVRNKLEEEMISFQEIALTQNLLEFSGKRNPTDPIINFKQLFVTSSGIGYTLTASYLPSEDESVVKLLNEMLNSFTLK